LAPTNPDVQSKLAGKENTMGIFTAVLLFTALGIIGAPDHKLSKIAELLGVVAVVGFIVALNFLLFLIGAY